MTTTSHITIENDAYSQHCFLVCDSIFLNRYPASNPAYSYAIQTGRADAIMAQLGDSMEEVVHNLSRCYYAHQIIMFQVEDLDEDTMLEMQKEANLTKEQLEKR